MSIPIFDVVSQYIGAGNLAAYTFDFMITDPSQIIVVVTDNTGVQIERVNGNDTTFLNGVTFDPVNGGGTVNLLANLPVNYNIYLILAGDSPVQLSQFRNKGSFDLFRFEKALDALASFVQRCAYLAQRSVKLNDIDQSGAFDPTLPAGMNTAVSLIPSTNNTGTGWAPISQWTPVANLLAAVSAAAAAAVSAAAAAASQVAAAASAAAAAASATAAAASAASVTAIAPLITGTFAAPIGITAAGGIAFTGPNWWNTWFVNGNGGPIEITAVPAIAAPTMIGQTLDVICTDDVNTLTIDTDSGTVLVGGKFVGQSGSCLRLRAISLTQWLEIGRSQL